MTVHGGHSALSRVAYDLALGFWNLISEVTACRICPSLLALFWWGEGGHHTYGSLIPRGCECQEAGCWVGFLQRVVFVWELSEVMVC